MFCEVPIKSTCRKKLLKFALQSTDWELGKKESGGSYTFMATRVPYEIFKDDVFLNFYLYNILGIKNKKNLAGLIFKMKPKTFYVPHTDTNRTHTINLLLNDECESTTFFVKDEFRPSQVNVEFLEYDKDKYYVLNTQELHSVVNKNQDRYVFSFGNNKISYDEVVKSVDKEYKLNKWQGIGNVIIGEKNIGWEIDNK